METAALVSSILSIILSIIIGGFAIWLSVTFYKMSNKISEDTKDAAKGISDSVRRLESVFDKLYSDTFSMMKDTVTDMRKHIWPVKEQSAEEQKKIEEEANAKIGELQNAYFHEIKNILTRIGDTDSKIDDVEKNLKELVEGAIQGVRKVESEAQEEKSITDVANVISHIFKGRDDVPVREIIKTYDKYYPEDVIIDALKFLLDKGPYLANGEIDNLDTAISWF